MFRKFESQTYLATKIFFGKIRNKWKITLRHYIADLHNFMFYDCFAADLEDEDYESDESAEIV